MGTALRKSPERRYVEDVLGIDALYAEATDLMKTVNVELVEVASGKGILAALDRDLDMREYELRMALREAIEFKSQAAEERALGDAKMSDQTYQGLLNRKEHEAARFAEHEVKLRTAELGHRSVVARMNNLGAYLTYQAACKTARTASLDMQFPV